MATAQCKAFIDEHFVVWGGSLEYSEPFVVSESIQSSGFPFMAVLLCGHSDGAHCLERIEGVMGGPVLIERLNQSMQRHQANLTQIQQQQQRRQDSQQLRQEQNLEFERALQADREREAKEQTERLRLEQAEDEARSKAELEAALELSEKLVRLKQTTPLPTPFPPPPPRPTPSLHEKALLICVAAHHRTRRPV